MYTIKSGYKAYWNSIIDQHKVENQEYNQQFTILTQFKQTWKAIWEMKTQPKTRTFTWRAARNILPTKRWLI